MVQNDQIYRDVEQAWKRASTTEKPLPNFVDQLENILSDMVSGQPKSKHELSRDIGFLHRTYTQYNFKDHQLILLASNYLKKTVKIDCMSQQGPQGKQTYMRLVGGRN
ncbi:hypothetical protein [Fodinibius sp. SL11]|uniref:hypothetical protein n=1 Tax=Fodinibius sp. SL11 TaxID=3425690 RepID=UPI003F882CEC